MPSSILSSESTHSCPSGSTPCTPTSFPSRSAEFADKRRDSAWVWDASSATSGCPGQCLLNLL
ncbi:hypothetical protein BD413DRAFT_599406, partial [Trametes elegans]